MILSLEGHRKFVLALNGIRKKKHSFTVMYVKFDFFLRFYFGGAGKLMSHLCFYIIIVVGNPVLPFLSSYQIMIENQQKICNKIQTHLTLFYFLFDSSNIYYYKRVSECQEKILLAHAHYCMKSHRNKRFYIIRKNFCMTFPIKKNVQSSKKKNTSDRTLENIQKKNVGKCACMYCMGASNN